MSATDSKRTLTEEVLRPPSHAYGDLQGIGKTLEEIDGLVVVAGLIDEGLHASIGSGDGPQGGYDGLWRHAARPQEGREDWLTSCCALPAP